MLFHVKIEQDIFTSTDNFIPRDKNTLAEHNILNGDTIVVAIESTSEEPSLSKKKPEVEFSKGFYQESLLSTKEKQVNLHSGRLDEDEKVPCLPQTDHGLNSGMLQIKIFREFIIFRGG